MELILLTVVSCFIVLPVFALIYQWARAKKFYSIVDVVWAYSFAFLALVYVVVAANDRMRVWIMALMFFFWSIRLGSHLGLRLYRRFPQEDRRYSDLRLKWSQNIDQKFLLFFLMQGLSVVILSLPLMLVMLDRSRSIGVWEFIALPLWLVGIICESVADWQLRKFKADPANEGEVCQVGLWKYSRHPNYFFEWLMWLAYFVYALPSANGWLAILSPALMLWLLTKVTGIPYAEKSSLSSKGDKFRAYQKSTSAFVPLPKRV